MIAIAVLLFGVALTPGMQSQSGASPSDSAPPSTSTAKQITQDKPVPKDPAEILRLASTMNGLDVSPAKPWHVKLTYDRFDDDGDNVESGTYEEYYVSPKKYKRISSGDALNQIDIGNDSGLYRSGDQRWLAHDLENEALRPLYHASSENPKVRLGKISWQIGSVKLPCVILRQTDTIISDNGLPKFCFDPDTVRLRYTRGEGWDETVYNSFVLFQGRYVARDITITHGGKASTKIHIEELETIANPDESLFVPPPGNSGPLGGRIVVSDAVLGEYLILKEPPVYPRDARGVPIAEGKVNVKYVVGKDGRVIQADAVDGPAELRKAALDALRKFRFRPFLILDQPVEVESSTSFEFRR